MFNKLLNYLYYWTVVFLLISLLIIPPVLKSKSLAETVTNAHRLVSSVDLKTAISQVAEKNIPAVAHIEVTQRQEIPTPMLPFENDPFFRYFFDAPMIPKKLKRELRGSGSGIIMDSKGYILTNNHVVDHAAQIEVLLSNNRRYKAKLVGTDPKTDLAVIRIKADQDLPHVTFGNSDRIKVGNWVIAIGHPRGLDQTVTQGIISAKHRQGITNPSTYQDFIQTDAAINPGNSGGPLLNLEGKVIGVNAAIVSQSGGFEGISFAIPSNMALHIAKELMEHGKVVRGWLGVSIQSLTPEMAESFGLKTTKGALIADLVKNGPAQKAGVLRGDVVTVYGGKRISDAGDLRNDVAATAVGQTVQIMVWRNGQTKNLSVRIGNLESGDKLLAATTRYRLGAEFRSATAKEVRKYNMDSGQGVAIIWLDPDGPLGKAGFEPGDIILEINGQSVEDLSSFVEKVNSIQHPKRITFLALDHRSGQTGYVQVVI